MKIRDGIAPARQQPARILGVFGGTVALLTAALAGAHTLPAYLFSFVFWTGISTGSLTILMVYHLTGGTWGEALRPALEAATRTLPMMALWAVPLMFGQLKLYPWAAASSPFHWYLQPGFFALRAAIYILAWLWLGARVLSLSRDGQPAPVRSTSAFGLVVMALTLTLAAFDWVMSRDPRFFSAIFGLMVSAAQVAAALSLAILWRLLTRARPALRPFDRQDLGNMLLACVLLWAYLAFMQFLTVWIADLPNEIRWYLPRLESRWHWLIGSVIALNLVLPVPLLITRSAKRSRAGLATAAALIFCGQIAYTMWLVLPSAQHDPVAGGASVVTMLVAAGSMWLSSFLLPAGRGLFGQIFQYG